MGFFSSEKRGKETSASKGHGEQAIVQSTVLATSSTAEQYRPVFLLCYESATFKAHWALFAPHAQSKTCKTGRKLHVTGNVQQGFHQEIIRNYDLSLTRTKPLTPIEIGLVSTRHLVDIAEDFHFARDTTARDAFEQLVLSVPAPNQSLNRVSDNPVSTKHTPNPTNQLDPKL